MKNPIVSAIDLFRKTVLGFAAVGGLHAFASGTVTNCTEADFRSALASGGEVAFACSGRVLLSNTVVVSANTQILGNGYQVVVDGDNSVALFEVNTNVSLEIHDVILANGSSVGARGADGSPPAAGSPGFGGGILSLGGAVTLLGCTLTNLNAIGGHGGEPPSGPGPPPGASGGDGFGGAICNLGGPLYLTNCTFGGNQASGGAGSESGANANGGRASGGAIYSDGGLVCLNHVVFYGNQARGGGWVFGSGGSAAGGALFGRQSQWFVAGSSLAGNVALGGGCLRDTSGYAPGGPSGDGLGGSVYLSADSTAMLQRCSFATNSANGGNGTFLYSAGKGQGGAIFNLGTAQIRDTLLSSNTCQGGDLGTSPPNGQGGAIFSANVLWLDGCTFSANGAVGGDISSYHVGFYPGATGDGGAVWSSGELRATNSTFVANHAAGGAGPYLSGAGASGGALRVAGGTGILVNVTISGNRADGWVVVPGSLPAYGGGLSCTNATVTLRNSIIANSGFGGDTWGAFTDAGYNLCSDATANLSATGSLNSVDPLLGALADNGGPTPTLLLLNGSPARDAVPVGFPPVDQRGVLRPQGVAADMGAAEGGKIQTISSQIALEPSSAQVSIVIQATAGSSYRLLTSPDLVDWTCVASLSTNASGPLRFMQPVLPDAQRFFEVESP